MKIIIVALSLPTGKASATEIKVISVGPVEPGLKTFAQMVRRDLGHELRILYNTAPQIAKRLSAGEVYDILISSTATIEMAIEEGTVIPESRTNVGRVGAGIAVRAEAPTFSVATVDALTQALLDADSVVYNTASTGIYLDKLFATMGLAEALKAKTTRYPNGDAVINHVIKGKGKEIGFGAIPEIRLYESKGIKLVGPLPEAVQNYTNYEAVLMTGTTVAEAARVVLLHLATPEAKAAFTASGVE